MSGLKVFVDYFSQPCRAVLMLLEINKISYSPQLIKVVEGEHKSEEFKKITPSRKVPAIDDNGFCLFESAAIMMYLVQKCQLPDHWYPSDLQRRAKIDEYLHWHHSNLRVGVGHNLFESVIGPRLVGIQPNEEKLKEFSAILKVSNKMMEGYFLKETKFISSNSISIADLQAVCEYTQFWVVDKDPCGVFPLLAQWLEDCKAELQPHFDASHKMIYMARDRGTFKAKV